MKRLLSAVLTAVIVPALALADAAPTTAQPENSAQAQQTTTTTTTTTTTESKDEKKDDKAAKDPKAAAAAQQQNALANAVQARTPEEQAKQSGFQFAFGLDHYIGTGTFINPQYYASLTAAPSLSATYLFHPGGVTLAASGRVIAYYEYTLPDTPNGRRFFPQDIRLGLVAPSILRDKAVTGIGFTPSVGLVIPATQESFTAGMITTVSLGAAVTRSFNAGPVGSFDFRLSGGASKGVYTSPVNGIRKPNASATTRDALGTAVLVCRDSDVFCVSNGANPNFALSLGGNVNWRITGNLIAFGGYTYSHTFREQLAAVGDPTIPQALDSNGNPVAQGGLGEADVTRTFLGLSYQLNEHYNLDFYMYTEQTPLVRKDAVWAVRFPLGSFDNAASNNTSIVVSLGAAY